MLLGVTKRLISELATRWDRGRHGILCGQDLASLHRLWVNGTHVLLFEVGSRLGLKSESGISKPKVDG